jgi:hypothetical protein
MFLVSSTTTVGIRDEGGDNGDGGVQLADNLKIFKTDNFDLDVYVQSKCQTMNEKVSLPACYLYSGRVSRSSSPAASCCDSGLDRVGGTVESWRGLVFHNWLLGKTKCDAARLSRILREKQFGIEMRQIQGLPRGKRNKVCAAFDAC